MGKYEIRPLPLWKPASQQTSSQKQIPPKTDVKNTDIGIIFKFWAAAAGEKRSRPGPALLGVRLYRKRKKRESTKYLQLLLQTSGVNPSSPVQAISGESGLLTCHAPVTSRSVELDFLVGTENPIRLLYSVASLTPDKGKQGVPDWENSFCRLFSLFWGGAMVWKLRPVLPVTAARIGLQVDDGAGPRCQLPDRSRWLARLESWRD